MNPSPMTSQKIDNLAYLKYLSTLDMLFPYAVDDDFDRIELGFINQIITYQEYSDMMTIFKNHARFGIYRNQGNMYWSKKGKENEQK